MLSLPAAAVGRELRGQVPLLVHAPATLRRLDLGPVPALDLLELFAFVLPARSAAPTPRGLALALDMDPPAPGLENAAAALPDIAATLLSRLIQLRGAPVAKPLSELAARMGSGGWGWTEAVLAALGLPGAVASDEPLRVWKRLPEWEELPPAPPPSALGVTPDEARTRLAAILGDSAEARPGQSDYAAAVTDAFAPREQRGDPHLVLAEAGTGTGKTLGYVAPASLWAERNKGAVWVSTFTRHLQRQVEGEMARLIPNAADRRRRVVVRKGRENYLCLLNLQDALGPVLSGGGHGVVPLGLIARWAMATNDGDIQGGDLPGWFADLFGAAYTAGLADLVRPAQRIVQHLVSRGQQAVLGSQEFFFRGANVADGPPEPVGHAKSSLVRPTVDRTPPYLFCRAVDMRSPDSGPAALRVFNFS